MADRFGAAPKPPWTWACLACNTTGAGPADVHRCPVARPDFLGGFWRERLRWTVPRLGAGEINALLAAPVARAELVRLLGDRWRPELTAPAATSASVSKEAA